MKAFSEDIIFSITSYLDPRDLVSVALTCKHFGEKPADAGAAAGDSATDDDAKKRKGKKRRKTHRTKKGGNSNGGKKRNWSQIEEVARKRVDATINDAQWKEKWEGTDVFALSKRRGEESWITVVHRLHLMRTSLVFHHFIDHGVSHVKGDPTHVQAKRSAEPPAGCGFYGNSIAICQEVMTEGKHYAEFTMTQDGYISPGIMRPIRGHSDATKVKSIDFNRSRPAIIFRGTENNFTLNDYGLFRAFCDYQRIYDERRGRPGYEGSSYSFYRPLNTTLVSKNTVVGLLLELDRGIISYFVNGEYKRSGRGLAGHYCWAVLISKTSKCRSSSVKIDRKEPPSEYLEQVANLVTS